MHKYVTESERRTSLWTAARLWVALVVLAVAVGVVCEIAFAGSLRATSTGIEPPGPGVGTELDSALPADIAHLPLVDQNGLTTDLAAFRGRVLMIADSMTLCQETCPLDTEDLVQTARALDADGLGEKVEFLTITIDPARDTPTQLSAYRQLYKPVPSNWQTLTGSPATISTLWKYFGVYIQKVPEPSPPSMNWRTGQKLTYDLNHSDEIFFVDANGAEKFLLEGMGHIAHGSSVPPTLAKQLDAQGLQNLTAPASDGWTVPQGLQVLSWLLQRPLPQAS